jgi:hypothetical protein
LEGIVDSTWSGTRRDVERAVVTVCITMGSMTSLGGFAFDPTFFTAVLWFVLGFGFCVAPAVGAWRAIERAWLRWLCGGSMTFVAPLMPAALVLFGWTSLDLPAPIPQLASSVVYLLPAGLGWHVEALRQHALDTYETERETR